MEFDKEHFNNTCEVCKRIGVVGVASSSLGAISFAYCRECLDNNAEPEWMFGFTWDACNHEVANWVRELNTWVDGKYITWEEFEADAIANPSKWIIPEPEEYQPNNEELDLTFGEYKCVNGHDLCNQSYPGPDCPYCEKNEYY